jgi:Ku70/Ku80 beta-barrel domain
MEVEAFVEGGEINPLGLSGVSYFLVPDGKIKGSAKPYRLLADAMRRSGRLAVTVWGMRGREHPFVIGSAATARWSPSSFTAVAGPSHARGRTGHRIGGRGRAGRLGRPGA